MWLIPLADHVRTDGLTITWYQHFMWQSHDIVSWSRDHHMIQGHQGSKCDGDSKRSDKTDWLWISKTGGCWRLDLCKILHEVNYPRSHESHMTTGTRNSVLDGSGGDQGGGAREEIRYLESWVYRSWNGHLQTSVVSWWGEGVMEWVRERGV